MQVNVPDATGVPYARVKAHFTLNYDEEALQASGGVVTVVGAAGAKKHEKIQGGRVKITTMKCGNPAGNSGPWYFLMSGKNKRAEYTDQFLLDHGAPPGSTIVMTETG